MTKVYTIGHSTRKIDEFIYLLKLNKVKLLVDIRTIPRSRHNPQFGQEDLEIALLENSVKYKYMAELGGLRPKVKNSCNFGWHNESFRNYADYMQTGEFNQAITSLIDLANEQTTVIMCAEAVPWRCHRSLIGDALIVRGVEVYDIMSTTSSKLEHLTPFAKVENKKVTYPDDQPRQH